LGHFSQVGYLVDQKKFASLYFASMQDNKNSIVLSALLKALRPIARLLMKSGIGYREFSEISKCAFVDVATMDYGLRGRPTNISRVAVMTGLTRKEVKRLRDKISAGTQVDMTRVIPPAEIIEKWHTDPEFVDRDSRPRRLPFDGSTPSFAGLVKKYGGDIPPGAMRTELKRVGAIEEGEDDYLTVVKRYFRPIDTVDQMSRALGQALYGLSLNLNHNLGQPAEESWVERTAFSTSIRSDDKSRVRRISQDRASEFIESVNDLFSAYETIYSDDEPGSESSIVGVGVFYFETDENESEFARS
jgi:hypothetical protein